MTMKLYRPTPDGGLEPAPVEAKDHRRKLRSRRWDAAELANPEADVTNPWIAATRPASSSITSTVTRLPQIGERRSAVACGAARRCWWGMLVARRKIVLL